ncbi:MAG: hypothetical protein ABEH43_06495, partial [Flavobacteriales bacterium]
MRLKRLNSILFLAVVLLSVFNKNTTAQSKNEVWLGARGSNVNLPGKRFLQGYGIQWQIFVGNEIDLNYHLTFGADDEGNFHLHSYMGGAGSVLLFASGLGDKN